MGTFAPQEIFGNVWGCFLLPWLVRVENVYGCLVSRGQKSYSTVYGIEDSAHNKELSEQNISDAEVDLVVLDQFIVIWGRICRGLRGFLKEVRYWLTLSVIHKLNVYNNFHQNPSVLLSSSEKVILNNIEDRSGCRERGSVRNPFCWVNQKVIGEGY